MVAPFHFHSTILKITDKNWYDQLACLLNDFMPSFGHCLSKAWDQSTSWVTTAYFSSWLFESRAVKIQPTILMRQCWVENLYCYHIVKDQLFFSNLSQSGRKRFRNRSDNLYFVNFRICEDIWQGKWYLFSTELYNFHRDIYNYSGCITGRQANVVVKNVEYGRSSIK